jgi:Listeria-Bacteroides repeat domain (List_Bact_rpt)
VKNSKTPTRCLVSCAMLFSVALLFLGCPIGNDSPVANYTITFDKNDAAAVGTMADQTIASGSSANLTVNAFTNASWGFAGWATTTGGAVVFADGASYSMGTSDVTLFAKWTQLPVVTTGSATVITGTTATLNGQTNPSGSATTGWFRYSATNPGTPNDTSGTRAPPSGGTSLGSGTAAAPYSQNITGLTPGTTYYFWAISQSGVGNSFGSVQSFTTSPVYTVTFKDPGGGVLTTRTVTPPATTVANLPASIAPAGKTGDGKWWTGTGGTGTEFTTSTIVTSSIVVYANWTPWP